MSHGLQDRSELRVLWHRRRIHNELRHLRAAELCGAASAQRLGTIEIDWEAAACKSAVTTPMVYKGQCSDLAFVAPRCVLVSAIVNVISIGTDAATAVAAAAFPPTIRNMNVKVLGGNAKRKALVRQSLHELGVGCATSKHSSPVLCCFEESGALALAWEVASGGAKKQIQVLQQRPERGPTSMNAEIALVTANIASVNQGGAILDPCVGAGALLQAASLHSPSAAFGADTDVSALKLTAANFDYARLPQPLLVQADAKAAPWALRGQA